MKPAKVIGLIVIVAVLAVGGYFVFHKPYAKTGSTAGNSRAKTAAANAPAVNNAVLTTKTSAGLGKYLADPDGKPLYTYDADTSGTSNCSDSCISIWPAYQATGSTANLPAGIGTIKRSDSGAAQYTYNGQPLYYFASDSGSTPTGDGVGDFSLARPAAAH